MHNSTILQLYNSTILGILQFIVTVMENRMSDGELRILTATGIYRHPDGELAVHQQPSFKLSISVMESPFLKSVNRKS